MRPTFQRARSDEQRAERRQAILDVTSAMLSEAPVASVTLTEISRRVGLAKSNVLRYFDSREAVLLELLDGEWRAWLEELSLDAPRAVDEQASVPARTRQLAGCLAASLAGRRVLGDLLSAQAAVLERNVSPEVAARFKRCALRNTGTLAGIVLAAIPELGDTDATRFAMGCALVTGALFAHGQPSPAMLAAYAADPTLAAMRVDVPDVLEQLVVLLLAGLLATAAETG